MTTIEIVSDANCSHRLIGQAHVTRSRGQVSTTFLYGLLGVFRTVLVFLFQAAFVKFRSSRSTSFGVRYPRAE